MGNYSNIPIGLRIPTQIPLNAKENIADEATLKDLGINDNLAFTYEKGLIIYCKLEGTRYEWREVLSGEELTGLRDTDYIYPNGVITNDVDYSNKKYNFFTIENNTSNIFIEEGDNIVIDGNGSNVTPYIISGLSSPFNSVNNSYFPRNRNESQFGDIGQFSYDFSFAEIGANGEPEGQIGQNGVQPDELYGSLGNLTYTFGYNLSAQGYNDSLFGRYNHSGLQSEYSTILGRNNYNNSKNSLLSGSYNKIIYNILGNSTVFGQGNIINGAVGLTSGVSLLNKSFGTTVLGQANTDYTDTSEDINEALSPILIVGNGNIATPDGIWTSTLRSDALKLLKNGLLTLPSVTNDLIENDVTGKAVVTKEYLETVFPNTPDGSETKIIPGTNIGITGNGTTLTPYVISSNNDDISQYTNEMAQDAVGSILQNSDTIEFVYDDDNNTIHANLKGEAYRFITKTGFTLVDNVITINPLNVWLINNIEYSNPLSIELTIPYSTSGNQRIIYIVPNNTNSFDIISGEESVSTPGAPTLEFPDLYLTFYLVTDGTVGETVLPNYNDLFLKRYKLTYKTSQSDFNLEPGEDDYNVIFTGTTNSSINIFPNGSYGKYIRNGAIYPFKNMGTGIVSIWSGIGVTVNAPNGLILNPNHQCYIIKDDWNEWTVINPPNLTGYELKSNKQNDLTPDGTGTKYPTVDAVNAVLPKDYSKVVYVNATSPTTATIFDLNNPPTTNDNLLKNDTSNLYIGTDASTWVYLTGTGYVTKIVPSTSNFNTFGTSVDAGNSKTSHITRSGAVTLAGPLNILNLKIATTPTTSAGSYDILTRNSSTTALEKKLLSDFVQTTTTQNISGRKNLTSDNTTPGGISITSSRTNNTPGTSDSSALTINNTGGNAILIETGTGDGILAKAIGAGSAITAQTFSTGAGLTLRNQGGTGDLLSAELGKVTISSAGKLSTTELATTGNNVPNKTYVDSKITQTITNGVTDKSPSEDAVFDALANVKRNLISNTTTTSPVTGTVTQTALYSQLIPANTFINGGFFNIEIARIGKTGTAGTLRNSIRINTTNTVTGSTLIADNIGTNTNLNIPLDRKFSIEGGNLVGFGTSQASSDIINSSLAITSYTFNPTIDNYIFVCGTMSVSTDSMFFSSLQITN